MTACLKVVDDVLCTLGNELEQPINALAAEAAEKVALRTVVRRLRDLQQHPSSSDISHEDKIASALASLRILVSKSSRVVANHPWNLRSQTNLAIYVDARILTAVAQLLFPNRVTNWHSTLKQLDLALIVGEPEGERGKWIHSLIAAIQPHLCRPSSSMSPCTSLSPSSPPSKRRRKERTTHIDERPLYAPMPIRSIAPPSVEAYHTNEDLKHQPFILRDYVRWPALRRWQSAEYLLGATGERYVTVEVGGAYDQKGWGQKVVPWRQFLSRAGWEVDEGEEEVEDEKDYDVDSDSDGDDESGREDTEMEGKVKPLYLAQTQLFSQFPMLLGDFEVPEYAVSDTKDTLVNVWIGSGGKEIVSPAHTDPHFNCYAQVVGYKRVWIAPPDSKGLAVHGSREGLADSTSELAERYMSNTSGVPLFREPLETIKERHPEFMEGAYPQAMEAVLEPGDLLVFPPRWWHSMRGEGDGPCWSVSFWY